MSFEQTTPGVLECTVRDGLDQVVDTFLEASRRHGLVDFTLSSFTLGSISGGLCSLSSWCFTFLLLLRFGFCGFGFSLRLGLSLWLRLALDDFGHLLGLPSGFLFGWDDCLAFVINREHLSFAFFQALGDEIDGPVDDHDK